MPFNGFALFVRTCMRSSVRASVCASWNIINTISCRVFDTFSPNLHQRCIMGQRWMHSILWSKGHSSRPRWNSILYWNHHCTGGGIQYSTSRVEFRLSLKILSSIATYIINKLGILKILQAAPSFFLLSLASRPWNRYTWSSCAKAAFLSLSACHNDWHGHLALLQIPLLILRRLYYKLPYGMGSRPNHRWK